MWGPALKTIIERFPSFKDGLGDDFRRNTEYLPSDPNYALSIGFKACTNQVQSTLTEKGGSEKINRSTILDSCPEICIVDCMNDVEGSRRNRRS